MNNIEILELQDKFAYLPIFARMLKAPTEVLSRASDYKLTSEDFAEKFHKILFTVIGELYQDDVKKITKIEINARLQNYVELEHIYKNNSGDEYVDAALELEEIDNFDYHYNRIKKFSILRRFAQDGFDITEIYDTSLFETSEIEERAERFNKMTIDEISSHFTNKMINIKEDYLMKKEGVGGHFSEGIRELIAEKALAPSYGANFTSGLLNTATRGARNRKLYCISGDTGSGKTRGALANLLYMCIPEIYDAKTDTWIKLNNRDRGVFITTELEEDEIKIPAVCFIAEVDEEKVQNNQLSKDEAARIEYAIKVLEKTPIWFEEMFDFDDDDFEQVVEKYVNKHQITKIAHDYLHSTLKMFESLAKRGARGLQEHQVLRISSIRLKNICNKYGVWIGTGTQLNSNWKHGVLDQSAIEGSRSVANKFDMGAIQIPLRPEDEALWEEIKVTANLGFIPPPTHTINIYKNRGNRHKMIRIWVNFNLGTLRMMDLFVTNYKGEIIDNVSPTFVEEFLDYDEPEKEVFKTEEEEIQEVFAEEDIMDW